MPVAQFVVFSRLQVFVLIYRYYEVTNVLIKSTIIYVIFFKPRDCKIGIAESEKRKVSLRVESSSLSLMFNGMGSSTDPCCGILK